MIKHMCVLKYLGSGSVQTEKAAYNIFCQNSDLLLKYYLRFCNSEMISYVIVLFSEMLFGVKIVITGDTPPKSENAIIIMNHRCRLDWMFYWSAVARHGELKHEKIMMKHELKYSPGPG